MSSTKAAKVLMKLKNKGVIGGSTNKASIRGQLETLKRKKNKTEAEKKKMEELQKRVDKLNEAEELKNRLKRTGSKKKVSLVDTSSITGARAKGGEAKMKKKGMKAGGAMMKRRKMASGGSGEGIDPKAIKTKAQFENLLAKGKLEHLSNPQLVDVALRVKYITADEMMGNAKGGAMMKKKGMAKGGMKKKGYMAGGLKKPAAGQTGLKKLPTPVRNKMGYAKKGGSMKKKGYAAGGLKKYGTVYRSGGAVPGKMYGSVDNRKKK